MLATDSLSNAERHASPYYALSAEGRRHEEIRRLDMQHRLFVRLCDNRLVFVDLDLRPGDSVLDSATGAGSWAFDMISQAPSGVRIDAIDIDSRLFNLAIASAPTSPITNPSLNFHQGSILDFPKTWTNRFALINQRLLVAALTADQWKVNVSELHRVLAQNGWVQFLDAKVEVPEEELTGRPHFKAFLMMVRQLWTAVGLVGDPLKMLPDLLVDSGFQDVQWELRKAPIGSWAGIDGVESAENWMGVYLAMEGPFLRAGLIESKDALRKLVAAVRKEWDDVPGFSMTLGIVCGKKAKLDTPEAGERR